MTGSRPTSPSPGIYALSGNLPIAETVAGLWPHFKRCMGAALVSREVREGVWGEHDAIVRAFSRGSELAPKMPPCFITEKAGATLYARIERGGLPRLDPSTGGRKP